MSIWMWLANSVALIVNYEYYDMVPLEKYVAICPVNCSEGQVCVNSMSSRLDWVCISEQEYDVRQQRKKNYQDCLAEVRREFDEGYKKIPEIPRPRCTERDTWGCCPDEEFISENEVETGNGNCMTKGWYFFHEENNLKRQECERRWGGYYPV
jgi:hypothetical protein